MISIDGQSNETIVLDGEWFEKLRGGQSKTRVPAATFRDVDLKEINRRKGLFSSERETLIQLTLTFEGGPFIGFVTADDKRPKVDELLAGLESAKVLSP